MMTMLMKKAAKELSGTSFIAWPSIRVRMRLLCMCSLLARVQV